jgi:uncharacterized membrane protein
MMMNEKRQQILKWQQQGYIEKSNIEHALDVSESNHSTSQWLNFINTSLLWLSILSMAFGTIFFFAYNWVDLSTLQKFVLVQGLIVISTFFYTQTEKQSTANTAILFFIALLIGSLFALFGQTYQTGKDPWQLFFLWTVVITPIAFISRSSSLWLLWLFLANLALYLFFQTRHGLFGMLFQHERNMLVYSFLNLMAVVGFELLYHKKQMFNRIAAQTGIIIAMIAFTWVSVYSVFEVFHANSKSLDLFFYVLWMVAIYFYYRIKTLDVLVLSSWVVSGIVFILALVGKIFGDSFDEGTLLLFGFLIIGLSTTGVKWLMALLKLNHSPNPPEVITGDKA